MQGKFVRINIILNIQLNHQKQNILSKDFSQLLWVFTNLRI